MADEKPKRDIFLPFVLGLVSGVLLVALAAMVTLAVRPDPGADLPAMKKVARGVSKYEVLLRYEDPDTGHTVYVMRSGNGGPSVAVVPKGAK